MKVVCLPPTQILNFTLSGLIILDGIGLACGILKYLLERYDAPKVLAATHLHEILENGFLQAGPRLHLGHMEVQLSEDKEEQITYLYKYGPIH